MPIEMTKGLKSISKVATVAIIIVIIVIAGVGGYYYYASTSSKVTPTPPPSKGTIKIALMLAGVSNDLSWNQAGYSSAQALVHELEAAGYNVTLSVSEGLYTSEEIQPAMQTYASEGYTIVIGDGFQFTPVSINLASQFPNTAFLNIGGYQSAPGVQTVIEDAGQLGFIMGATAALLTHTGKVAIIGGEDVSEITWMTMGFQLGVAYINSNFNKNVSVITTFIGNFDDPAGALSAGTAAASQGADVLFCSGDGITEGVAQAAAQSNVMFLYCETNATAFAPENTYGGMTLTFGPLLDQAVNNWIVNKTLQANPYYATIANGGITLQLSSKVPANVSTIINTLYKNVGNNNIMIYYEASNGTMIYSPVTPPYSSLS